MIYHSFGSEYANDPYTLDDLDKTVRVTTKDLREHQAEFDSIVVTGMSGVVVGVPTSMRLRKPLVILRKPKDGSHASRRDKHWINVAKLGNRALFLDDFVSGGSTSSRVHSEVKKAGSKVAAQYMYRDREYQELS